MYTISTEFRKMISRREFYLLLMFSVLIAGAGFCERISAVYIGADVSVVPSAYRKTLVNGGSGIGTMLRFFLIPLFASFAYADCYYRECRSGIVALNITRTGQRRYYLSQASVSAIGGFLVVLFLLLVNQLFCLLGFPAKAAESSWSGSIYETTLADDVENVLFPNLYMNAPFLNNLVVMLFAGLWGAATALVTYAFSLYVRKNYFLTVGMAAVINIGITLMVIAAPREWGLEPYILMGNHLFADFGSVRSIWQYFIKMAVWFGVPVSLIAYRLKKGGDLLP